MRYLFWFERVKKPPWCPRYGSWYSASQPPMIRIDFESDIAGDMTATTAADTLAEAQSYLSHFYDGRPVDLLPSRVIPLEPGLPPYDGPLAKHGV